MTVVKTKKVKGTKKCVIKRKLKFEGYKDCLESIQLENKINHLEKKKKKNEVDTLKKYHKDFLKNYELILKTQEKI